MLPKKRINRSKTPEQAFASLQRLCARAERSSGDAMRLMATWSVEPAKRQEILEQLQRERFIDDKRYAEAFVREKINLSAWGEYKIRTSLKSKGIAEQIISEVMASSPEINSPERLGERLQRKIRTIKYKNPYDLKTKLMRYGLSLGFDMETVLQSVESVMQQKKNLEEQCDDIFFP